MDCTTLLLYIPLVVYYVVVYDILHILLDEDDTQFLVLQEILPILNSSVVKYWFPKPRVCGSIPSLPMYFFSVVIFPCHFSPVFCCVFFVLKRAKRAFWAKVIRMQKWNANEKKSDKKIEKELHGPTRDWTPKTFAFGLWVQCSTIELLRIVGNGGNHTRHYSHSNCRLVAQSNSSSCDFCSDVFEIYMMHVVRQYL